MASAAAPKVARGIIWQHAEIMDLLEIWGAEKFQALLNGSKRNITVFEDVAREMQQRGHSRSAQECRTKTKSMRQDYKNTVVHNSKSGNTPRTCPYFDRLREILHGDASIIPKRVASSIPDDPAAVPEVVQPDPQNPNSQDMFVHDDLPMVNVEEYMGTDVTHDLDQRCSEETDIEDTGTQFDAIYARMQGHMDAAFAKANQHYRSVQCTSPNREMQSRVGQDHEVPRDNALEPISPATPAAPGPAPGPAPVTPPGNHDPNDMACLFPPSQLRLIRGRDKRPRRAMRVDVMHRDFMQQQERHHRESLQQNDHYQREFLQQLERQHRESLQQKDRQHQDTIDFQKEILVCLNRSVESFNLYAQHMERAISRQSTAPAFRSITSPVHSPAPAVRSVTCPIQSTAPAGNTQTPPARAYSAVRLPARHRTGRNRKPKNPYTPPE